MAAIKLPVAITANDLLSGEAVYWHPSGIWSTDLTGSKVFESLEQAQASLQQVVSDTVVIGAYLAEVLEEGNRLVSRHYREGFRARGPSNYCHGKQECLREKVAV